MNSTEWRLVVDRAITLGQLPCYCDEFFPTAQDLGQMCGYLPRELRNYQDAFFELMSQNATNNLDVTVFRAQIIYFLLSNLEIIMQ